MFYKTIAYIPPFKFTIKIKRTKKETLKLIQRLTWDALRKTIISLINKESYSLTAELFRLKDGHIRLHLPLKRIL